MADQTIKQMQTLRAYSADRLHVASSVPALKAAKELYTRGPELEHAPLPPMEGPDGRPINDAGIALCLIFAVAGLGLLVIALFHIFS